MRHVVACTCCFAIFAFGLDAGELPSPDFTVVMNFKGSYSPQTLLELKQEADRIPCSGRHFRRMGECLRSAEAAIR